MPSEATPSGRASARRRLRLGVAGLGRAFMLMLPTFLADRRVALVAAADPRGEAREQFVRDFGGDAYESVDALSEHPDLDAVYLATPHALHAQQVLRLAAAGKHVLVEKPMALTLDECTSMIDAAQRANVHLIVGHSHSFDAPYLRTRALIAAGTYGKVRMIHALNYTDFLYRPRRPEELDTARGGGVVFSQGAHQIDVARLLGGGRVQSVRAHTGRWDPARPTEGAYAAMLSFEDGLFASLTYSGYAHFDSDELVGGIGELGAAKDSASYGAARATLKRATSADDEAALKTRRTYGAARAAGASKPALAHNHFGMLIVSCERADLRPMADRVMIYGDERVEREDLAAPAVPRVEVIDELYDAVFLGVPPVHDGRWARATLEVCLAILESSRTGSDVRLMHQVALAANRT